MSRETKGERNPFRFRNGRLAHTSEALAQLSQEFPADGAYHLENGHFAAWLDYIDEGEMARLAETAVQQRDENLSPLDIFLRQYDLHTNLTSLPPELQALLTDDNLQTIVEREQQRPFTFVLVGRAGTGKSSTINSLMGKRLARTSEFVIGTTSVIQYDSPPSSLIRYTVLDTPGLRDGSGNEEEYIGKIQNALPNGKPDCLWFVTNLMDTRVLGDELLTIQHITEAFGKKVWKQSIIVFTFADLLKGHPEKYQRKLQERTKLVRQAIAEHTDAKVANAIPAVAVANDDDETLLFPKPLPTPDGKMWLGKLFTAVFTRMNDEGMGSFLIGVDPTRLTTAPQSTAESGDAEQADAGPALIYLDLDEAEQKTFLARTKKLVSKWTGWVAQAGKAVSAGVRTAAEFTGNVAQTTRNVKESIDNLSQSVGSSAAQALRGFFGALSRRKKG